MRATLRHIATFAITLGVLGCSADYDGRGPYPRTGSVDDDSWTWPAAIPANGDLTIYQGANVNNGDYLLWDIGGSTIHDAGDPGVISSLQIQGSGIFDPDGSLACFVAIDQGQMKLYDATTGEVIATTHGRFVFEGDADDVEDAEVAIELFHEQVYAGRRSEGQLLGTATVELHNANPMRTLVYGALFMGECGSTGP
jgi:hypothetical protein